MGEIGEAGRAWASVTPTRGVSSADQVRLSTMTCSKSERPGRVGRAPAAGPCLAGPAAGRPAPQKGRSVPAPRRSLASAGAFAAKEGFTRRRGAGDGLASARSG